jgi:hypothetical protein
MNDVLREVDCTLSCKINTEVGGDHAYCTCLCHEDAPAIPPSRMRRPIKNHYLAALRAAKTPPEYAQVLGEWERVKRGYIAPWMKLP